MKKKIFKIISLVCIVLLILSLDLYSKYLIEENIKLGESIDIIKNFFSLTYVRNFGAAFSLFSGKVNILVLLSWAILLYLIYEIYSNFKIPYYSYFLSIIIGGLLGNLYDRIVFGYVRDFFDFNFFGYDFAVFNVSDMFVVIGTFLLIILIMFKGEVYGNNSRKRKSRK